MSQEQEDQLKRDKEIAKHLIGKVITLSPTDAFFVEDCGQYVLNNYGNLEDQKVEYNDSKVTIKEGWKLEPTLRNVRAGKLRVLDADGKDISTEFGGPVIVDFRKQSTPLVKDAVMQYNPDDARDKKLRGLLDNVDEKGLINNIGSQKLPYEVLKRLLELELAGENPSYRSRGQVVNALSDMIKRTSGIALDVEKQEEVTASSR